MSRYFDLYINFLAVESGICQGIDSLMAQRCENKVQGGPFKGMILNNAASWVDGNMSTKYVGSYEHELHGSIRKAVARKPETIINVGCAEGYYSVGLGRLLPYAHVYAMDADQKSLDYCAENARANGIINLVLVIGNVAPEDLAQGGGRKLYVVDIEGHESMVLDPERCPDLRNSDIIVECHDFMYCEGDMQSSVISDQLEKRFSETHFVERIGPQVPNMRDYPSVSGLDLGTAMLAVTEKRPLPTAWLACWTKERRGLNG